MIQYTLSINNVQWRCLLPSFPSFPYGSTCERRAGAEVCFLTFRRKLFDFLFPLRAYIGFGLFAGCVQVSPLEGSTTGGCRWMTGMVSDPVGGMASAVGP